MKFNIGDILPEEPQPKEEFQVVCRAMHGDADKFEDVILKASNVTELENIMNDILPVSKLDHHNSMLTIQKLKDNEESSYFEDWPWDVTCDSYPCSFDGFKIFWYNAHGRKFKVTVSE